MDVHLLRGLLTGGLWPARPLSLQRTRPADTRHHVGHHYVRVWRKQPLGLVGIAITVAYAAQKEPPTQESVEQARDGLQAEGEDRQQT